MPRRTRGLIEKLLIAFHQACDQADLTVAEHLLSLLNVIMARSRDAADRRHEMKTVVAAHERLWHLRNKDRQD